MKVDSDILRRIKERRKAKGYSQNDFAHLAGIPDRTYSDYERGVTPIPMDRLVAIARALDCSLSDLDPHANPPAPEQVTLGDLARGLKVIQDRLPNLENPRAGIDAFRDALKDILHDDEFKKIVRNQLESVSRELPSEKPVREIDLELRRLKKELGVIADAWHDLKPGRKAICLYFATGEEEFVSAFSSRTQGLLRLIFRSFDEK